MAKRSILLRAIASVLGVLVFAGIAHARDIRVTLDAAAPLRLSAPADGIAIGNPAIAAVSVQNDRLLFVTGRAYGTTNLIVVAGDGRVVYSGRVIVQPDETNTVMLTRGGQTTATERLECTPLCRPRPDGADRPTPTASPN